MAHRVGFAAVVVACAMVCAPIASQAAPAAAVVTAKPANPLVDPSHNTVPSARFVNACREMGTGKAANDRCDAAAQHDFDKVRKKEGLGRMTLPRDFDRLSVRIQLLAISNIERVDRGRRAVLGLSSSLNKLAQQGARQDRDPDFPSPFTGHSGGANWAGAGNSALLVDFYWMYDDGPGSFNIDCQHKGDSGCWGHRHNVIQPYDARLVMGAAAAYKTRFGTSMTEEFIGGDSSDKVNVSPTWHAIAATFPQRVAIAANRSHVAANHAATVTGAVTTHTGHARVAGQLVELEQRHASGARWTRVARRHTGAHGVVSFVVHPSESEFYRLVTLTKNGAHEGTSAAIRITIG